MTETLFAFPPTGWTGGDPFVNTTDPDDANPKTVIDADVINALVERLLMSSFHMMISAFVLMPADFDPDTDPYPLLAAAPPAYLFKGVDAITGENPVGDPGTPWELAGLYQGNSPDAETPELLTRLDIDILPGMGFWTRAFYNLSGLVFDDADMLGPSGNFGLKLGYISGLTGTDLPIWWWDGMDGVGAAVQPPTVKAYSGGWPVPTATDTDIEFTSADEWDTDAFHDPGGANPETFEAPSDGIYRVTLSAAWDANATGRRDIAIRVQDSPGGANNVFPGATIMGFANGLSNVMPLSMEVAMDAGQQVVVKAYQNSGTTIDCYVRMSITRVRDLP